MKTDEELAAEAAAAEAAKVSPKVDLTQEELNKVIDARLNRAGTAHAKALKERDEEIARLKASVEKDKVAKLKVKKGDNEDEEDSDIAKEREKFKDILSTEEQKRVVEERKRKDAEKERDDVLAENLLIRKNNTMQRAMQGLNFIDRDDVLSLTEKKVVWSDDHKRFVVLGEDGKPVENAKLEPKTLEEFYADFAERRPYLVAGNTKGGTGSSETGKSAASMGMVKCKADLKTVKEKSDWIEKHGIEAFSNLPLK